MILHFKDLEVILKGVSLDVGRDNHDCKGLDGYLWMGSGERDF